MLATWHCPRLFHNSTNFEIVLPKIKMMWLILCRTHSNNTSKIFRTYSTPAPPPPLLCVNLLHSSMPLTENYFGTLLELFSILMAPVFNINEQKIKMFYLLSNNKTYLSKICESSFILVFTSKLKVKIWKCYLVYILFVKYSYLHQKILFVTIDC